ncbi:hypothetical protein HMPREF9446_02032 [Bacteroides fluxus YIT 12057]|uniref:NVEALA protein n=2 Tax=Bacteroides fluxus TaxID=626930 RepID=F3PTG4_9BACE|nr:hypothetical protein HMPREF9446_02032 [Bacteroides fluxus YIT 12057]
MDFVFAPNENHYFIHLKKKTNMKKLIKIAFVAVFAVVAGYGVYTNQKSETMSDLMLANVEALASGETSDQCHTNADYSAICNYYDNGAVCPCGF